jgi:N-acetyltransferase 10
MDELFTPFDLKRLDGYGRSLVDYHTVTDLVPAAARLLFLRRLPVHLSPAQSAIVLAVGLQMRMVDDVAVRGYTDGGDGRG